MANHQNDENKALKLVQVLEGFQPIFKRLTVILNEAMVIEGNYQQQLKALSLHLKPYQMMPLQRPLTAAQIERSVKIICSTLTKLQQLITDMSEDAQQGAIYFDAGLFDKLKQTAEKIVTLLK